MRRAPARWVVWWGGGCREERGDDASPGSGGGGFRGGSRGRDFQLALVYWLLLILMHFIL